MDDDRQTRLVAGHHVMLSHGEGRPLLILTRMADKSIGLWDGVWDALAQRFQLAAVQPVLPSSDRFADAGAVFGDMATACADVATELGHDRFHIIGWNGGSHIALRCAADRGGRVASCVLVGAFDQLDDMRRVDAGVAFMGALLERGDAELYALYWVMSGLSPGFIDANFDQVEQWAARRAASDRFVSERRDAAIAWIRSLRRNWVTPEEAGRISARTLIIAPELDAWHAGPTVEMARRVQALVPEAVLRTVPDRGALFPLEDPTGFVDLVFEFWDQS